MRKFLLNYLCVSVVPINYWSPSEVTRWLFLFVFKIIENHHKLQRLQLNSDHFLNYY